MPGTEAVAVPSAVVASPQPTPEVSAPASPTPPKPLSQQERFDKAVKELEAKKEPGKQEVKTEESSPNPEDQANENLLPEVEEPGDFIDDKIVWNGKEASIQDVLGDATFEIPFHGEMIPIEGIDQLLEKAAIGHGASQTNREAKEVVLEADRLIKEIESSKTKEVQEGISKGLESLLDSALKGIDPTTGKSFPNQVAQTGAVDLLNRMKTANQQTPSTEKPLTKDEIAKLVDEQAEKKYKGLMSKAQEERFVGEIIQTANDNLQKTTEPLMQFFTLEDGKTLNKRVFTAFQRDVRSEADRLWFQAGKPMEKSALGNFINSAARQVLKEYRPTLTQKPSTQEPPKPPVLRPGSGSPAPASEAKPKFKDLEQAQRFRFEQATKGMKQGR